MRTIRSLRDLTAEENAEMAQAVQAIVKFLSEAQHRDGIPPQVLTVAATIAIVSSFGDLPSNQIEDSMGEAVKDAIDWLSRYTTTTQH